MSEMVAFRQGTSMPSRETILRYVVETVNQITELEPALHLLPWSGVNSAIHEQRFAQCYDEGLCAAQTSAPNVPQGSSAINRLGSGYRVTLFCPQGI